MFKDRYGNSVSTQSRAAADQFDAAAELIRLYRGDPIGTLDAALETDPGFTMAWAVRAGLLAQQTDKAYFEEAARSLRAAEASAAGANARERAHIAAARDWIEGRYDDGTAAYARIAQEHPRDLFAIQFAHIGCFFIGRQFELRDWPLQALRAWTPGEDGRGVLLGMAAFGLEECGDYARADALGREAVEIDPRDGWAVHAVAHVNEMRGDRPTGIAWLRDGAETWAPESGFAYHNWWHLALLYLDQNDHAEALKLYDSKVRPQASDILLECVDASALLWRLELEGADVGDRWANVADTWARTAEDGIYAFNDLHALMAFIGAGRRAQIAEILATMRRAAYGEGDNALMTRAVGLPLAEAFAAFGEARYAETVEKIVSVRGIAQRFGGSHAQRDVITLTALHAAIRAGMKETAQAFAAERLAHKPQSPWALKLNKLAAKIEARAAA